MCVYVCVCMCVCMCVCVCVCVYVCVCMCVYVCVCMCVLGGIHMGVKGLGFKGGINICIVCVFGWEGIVTMCFLPSARS